MASSGDTSGPSKDDGDSHKRKREDDDEDGSNRKPKKVQEVQIDVEVYQMRSASNETRAKHPTKPGTSKNKGTGYQVNVTVNSDATHALNNKENVEPGRSDSSNLVGKFTYSVDVLSCGTELNDVSVQTVEIKQNDCTIRLPIVALEASERTNTSFAITYMNGQSVVFASEVNMERTLNEGGGTQETGVRGERPLTNINEETPSTSSNTGNRPSQGSGRVKTLTERITGCLENTIGTIDRDKKLVGLLVESDTDISNDSLSQFFLTEIPRTGTVQELLIRNESPEEDYIMEAVRDNAVNVFRETAAGDESPHRNSTDARVPALGRTGSVENLLSGSLLEDSSSSEQASDILTSDSEQSSGTNGDGDKDETEDSGSGVSNYFNQQIRIEEMRKIEVSDIVNAEEKIPALKSEFSENIGFELKKTDEYFI